MKIVKKRGDIELIRIIGAFGIVWYHSGSIGHEIAYSGLVIFIILSMYLDGINRTDNFDFLQKVRRILVPWLVWFIIYGVINYVTKKPIVSIQNGLISGVLSGTQIHLWYMPFIFICLILFRLCRKFIQNNHIAYIGALISTFILLSSPLWREKSLQFGYPFSQYVHASAGVAIGIFFSQFHSIKKSIAIILYLLVSLSSIFAISVVGVGVPYFIGILVSSVLISDFYKQNVSASVEFISRNTLGIYFIHIFVFMIIFKFNLISGIFVPFFCFCLSLFFVAIIRRLLPGFSKYFI